MFKKRWQVCIIRQGQALSQPKLNDVTTVMRRQYFAQHSLDLQLNFTDLTVLCACNGHRRWDKLL